MIEKLLFGAVIAWTIGSLAFGLFGSRPSRIPRTTFHVGNPPGGMR